MRILPLQLLTWGTAAAAVSSALWLSAAELDPLLRIIGGRMTSPTPSLELPGAPTRAGPAAAPVSGARPREPAN